MQLGVAYEKLAASEKKLELRLRRRLATGVLHITAAANVAVLAIMWRLTSEGFALSDRVLIALISGTVVETASVVAIVARHLFPHESRSLRLPRARVEGGDEGVSTKPTNKR